MPTTALSSKVSGLKFMQRAAARTSVESAGPSAQPTPSSASRDSGLSSDTGAATGGTDEWTLAGKSDSYARPKTTSAVLYDTDWRRWAGDESSSSGLRKRYRDGQDVSVLEQERLQEAAAQKESEQEDAAPARGRSNAKGEPERRSQPNKKSSNAFKKPRKS